MTIFQRMGHWTMKMNITFSMGNGIPNTVLKFFPQTPSYRLNESQKPVLGEHFPTYQQFYWTDVSKKKYSSLICGPALTM